MKVTAATQLAEALHVTWSRPAETLLGARAAETITTAVDTCTPDVIARLERRDDTASEVAAAVLTALWPTPGSVPPTWWSTPLGETVRHAMDGPDVPLTHTETADLLGISRRSIGQMVARGNLTRHPDGGVSRDSVFHRLDARSGWVDKRSVEELCAHGVGHPIRARVDALPGLSDEDRETLMIHGCDGCCGPS